MLRKAMLLLIKIAYATGYVIGTIKGIKAVLKRKWRRA